MASSYDNRTLQRTAAILDAVDMRPALASEIARDTGLSLSTVHRLAMAMVEEGFLVRREDSRFSLGPRLLRSMRDDVMYPLLWELAQEVGETVQVWYRLGDERQCRISVDVPHELRVTLPVGSRLPLPDGSAGMILAREPEAMKELEETGWVESRGNRVAGVGSISAPITLQGEITAALCIAAPLSRVEGTFGEAFGEALLKTSKKISTQIH